MRKASKDIKYAFMVLFIINFLNYLDRSVLSGAANVVAKELGFGIDGIGYLSSVFIVLLSLSILPLGALADRSKRKNVIAICVAIWSTVTALTALAGNFLQLLISRMLLGIGEAGYGPPGSAMLADYFSRAKRAQVLSWWAVATVLGSMIGVIIGGVFAGLGHGTWRWAFLCAGVPSLVLALLAWRLREPQRNEADDLAAALDPDAYRVDEASERLIIPKKVGGQIRTLLCIKTLLVLTGMEIFAYFVLSATTVYLPTWLQQKDTFGLSSAAAGLYTGIGSAVAGIAGIVCGGYFANILNRRHPGSRVLVCGMSFLIGAPCFLLAAIIGPTTHNLFLYTCLFYITVFLLNIYVGPSLAALQDVVPSGLRASARAISICIAHLLGDAVSPSLVGILARTLDPTHGEHFAHNLAGYDLSLALICTGPIALSIAGLLGLIGSRWVKADMAAAQLAE